MPTARLTLTDGLVQLSFLLQSRLSRVAAEYDLSLAQLRLLGILRDRRPGMLELARYLELEKSSLSGLVDRAEKRGLVERVPSVTDRRAARLEITDRGRRLVRRVAAAVGADIAHLADPLSKGDREKLRALLEQMVLESGAQHGV